MKAYLVNACNPVLTVLSEFNRIESDPAQAAQLIIQDMHANEFGMTLRRGEPLHVRCGHQFVAVIHKPCMLVSLQHARARILRHRPRLCPGTPVSHWLMHPDLVSSKFDAVLLDSTWNTRPADTDAKFERWPQMHATQFAAVTGLRSVSSVNLSWPK